MRFYYFLFLGKSEMDGISLLQLHTELSAANASSKQLFRNSQNLYDEKGGLNVSHEFRVGMKLEAVDVSHSQFICVATVHDILFSRILIHFDGWPDLYDYWVEPWSNLIQPVGYCQNHGIRINVPKGYNPSKFTWLKYLKETSSSAAPASAFVKVGFTVYTTFQSDLITLISKIRSLYIQLS